MNGRVISLALVLLAFVAYSLQVVLEHGLVGAFTAAVANSASVQVVIDLVISVILIAIWVYRDASAKTLSAPLYAALVLCLGSIGTLIYLIRREFAGTGEVDIPIG